MSFAGAFAGFQSGFGNRRDGGWGRKVSLNILNGFLQVSDGDNKYKFVQYQINIENTHDNS